MADDDQESVAAAVPAGECDAAASGGADGSAHRLGEVDAGVAPAADEPEAVADPYGDRPQEPDRPRRRSGCRHGAGPERVQGRGTRHPVDGEAHRALVVAHGVVRPRAKAAVQAAPPEAATA